MYTSIYLLPQNSDERSKQYQDRWKSKIGIPIKHHILKKLRNGGSDLFLQKDFAEKQLSILEHDKDLRGLSMDDESLENLPADTLKGIDFSYAYILHTKFHDLNFTKTIFSFASLYHVTFINCVFSFSTFYASRLENVTFIGCDFLERNNIRNCRFNNVKFKHCFFENNIFHSCRFDERTNIDSLIQVSRHAKKTTRLNPKEIPELYKGIKEGFLSGNVINKSRDYYFLERQAITRYLIDNTFQKFGNYFLEIVAGYGIRPLRVLLCMGLLFVFFTTMFIAKIGYPDGLLLSAGAYFTNGADSQFISSIGIFYQTLYILESFLGILFTTLFITVMANLWFSEK